MGNIFHVLLQSSWNNSAPTGRIFVQINICLVRLRLQITVLHSIATDVSTVNILSVTENVVLYGVSVLTWIPFGCEGRM